MLCTDLNAGELNRHALGIGTGEDYPVSIASYFIPAHNDVSEFILLSRIYLHNLFLTVKWPPLAVAR